jgi:hypothetical protein
VFCLASSDGRALPIQYHQGLIVPGTLVRATVERIEIEGVAPGRAAGVLRDSEYSMSLRKVASSAVDDGCGCQRDG